jgi:homoserine kinase
MNKITVRVPATTANIGPGFDSMGCALALYNYITCEVLPAGKLVITGCPEPYQNEENLAVQGYRAVLSRLGLPNEGLSLNIRAEIPVCRGLGSSAAMIAGGAAAANLLHGASLSSAELLAVTNEIEGHPDNLAPAIYGGLTASLVEDGIPRTVRLPLSPTLRWVAAIPNFELSTHLARAVLPKEVAFVDAVYNASHVAVLVGALGRGDRELIAMALRDRLHQPYRESLIPEYGKVKAAAEQCGAIAFCISGAGPTLLALTDEASFAAQFAEKCKHLEHRWNIMELAVDTEGIVAE